MSLKEYPTSGAELPAVDEFKHLALDLIEPSLTNPRKHLDPTKLAELAESIKASGVHQPVLVRPLPGSRVEETTRTFHASPGRHARPTYELVCGDRRLRAAKIAGLATIPARILMMSDDLVLETQIVENLHRDDLSALEEAEGYEQLCTATGIRKEDIGAKIGKSRTYVYGRLKLLDLCPECQQAMRDGNLDASRALLLARIPDHQLQLKALDEATRIMFGGAVPSVRDLQTWLQRNVMLRLEAAPFVPADSQLVAAAGACNVCPKRTGANPDLFSDVDGADICTDPPCYRAKEEAHRAQVLATAAKRGMKLIEGDDAKEIIHHQYAPAAQAKGGGGQAKSQKAPLRKPKLSAADAQAAIAAAMQESEGTNPGAFAQNDNFDRSQPVAPAVAVAPAGSQAVYVPPKSMPYRGPNGETWTGRGLMPRWMSALIAQTGGSREDYRVAA